MSDIRDFFIKTLDEAESGKSFSHFSKVISSHTMIPCTCTTYLLLPQTFLFVNPRCGELYFGIRDHPHITSPPRGGEGGGPPKGDTSI